MSSRPTESSSSESAREPRAGRTAVFFCAAACAALIVLAYANSLRSEFHFDDSHVVVGNVYIRSLSNLPRFFTDARTFSSLPANATYRPLVSASLALDYRIAGGLSPLPFHVSQLVQLLALWAALAALYRRLFDLAQPGTPNAFLALLAATFFAIHTANTETMNLMHARGEILSALGIVVAFLLWLRSRTLRRSYLYLVPVALGALAKPPAVLFGPLLFVLVLLLVKRWRGESPFAAPGRGKLLAALRASVPALVAGAALFAFTAAMAAPGQTYGGGSRFSYALTQTWVWVHYVRLFLLPVGLTADTDLQLVTSWWDTRVFAGLILFALGAAGFLAAARRRRAWPIAFGLAWFALGLLPTSSVLPLAEPMNEHRIFLPYMGLVLAATWTARLLLPGWTVLPSAIRRPAAVSACAALLFAHAIGTWQRNVAWKTEASLWKDVTVKSPRNGRGHMNYGLTRMAAGDWAGTLDAFEKARLLLPNYGTLEINLGVLKAAIGKQSEAEGHFKRALALDPGAPASRTYYARWLVERGRSAEAVLLLFEAVRISPGDDFSRHFLMELLAARGDVAAAAEQARALLAAAPGDEAARAWAEGRWPADPASEGAETLFDLGVKRGQQRRYAASAVAYRAALAREPGASDCWNNLGWTLGELGFFPEGRQALDRALELRPGWERARNNRAALEARERELARRIHD